MNAGTGDRLMVLCVIVLMWTVVPFVVFLIVVTLILPQLIIEYVERERERINRP